MQFSPWTRKPLWVVSSDTCFTNENNNTSKNHNGIEMKVLKSEKSQRNNFHSKQSDEEVMYTLHHDCDKSNTSDVLKMERHLSLFGLVSIGVGGTIGSGIFVLCGLIAREYAGPATCLSWVIAGIAAFLSGCCYAELSGRIPSAGSSYAYAFASMGELPAFLTAACLTLEFLVSGSAVARSWGDKVVFWLQQYLHAGNWVQSYLNPGYNINPCAFLVSTASTFLLMGGVRESKAVTDLFTWMKVLLVIFMGFGGLILMDKTNFQPFLPPEFGVSGILRGSTSSFFGYLGFDGICCVAEEAQNPRKNLPHAIMITLVIVTALYIVAALALVGMQPYNEISPESGFPNAFAYNGIEWAAQLTAAGEIITLPIVVMLSVLLQPRLQYALARDGLLPSFFSDISRGFPAKGTLFAGVLSTIIATFVPFTYLDDFVSAGILIAFSITNSSLVILRHESPVNKPSLLRSLLIRFNIMSFLFCMAYVHGPEDRLMKIVILILFVYTWFICFQVWWHCPYTGKFGCGGNEDKEIKSEGNDDKEYFQAPFCPWLPCLGTFVNWYLISQLEMTGIIILFIYLALASALYFTYGAKHSLANHGGWGADPNN